MSAARASLWIIGGQELDDAEPVLLILPVRLESSLCFVSKIAGPLSPLFGSKLAIHRRYTERRFFWYSLLLFTGHLGATGAL